MRARIVLAGSFVAAALGAAAACGIDESGTANDASTDMVVVDVGPDGPSDAPIDVPQACSTLDATACDDAGLPNGWTYLLLSLDGDVPCPGTDFTKANYVYGLGTEAGACTCGTCAIDGGYSCAGPVEAGSKGNGCNGLYTVFDAGDDATCVDTGWNDPHIEIYNLPTLSGSPTCSVPTTGNQAWTGSTATGCTPGCTVDFCGATGFQRCVISTVNTQCPAPFTQPTPILGSSSKVSVSCDTCQCSVLPPSPCTAKVVASPAHDCSNPYSGNVPATGACVQPGGGGQNINSFLYTPTTPTPTCAVVDGGTGTASFASTVTVCCLPP